MEGVSPEVVFGGSGEGSGDGRGYMFKKMNNDSSFFFSIFFFVFFLSLFLLAIAFDWREVSSFERFFLLPREREKVQE